MKMDKKQLQRSAAATTAYMLEDLEILLGTKNPEEIWAHPEKQVAFDIVAEYRHKSSKTVEIRVQTLNNLVNGTAYESIVKQTITYLTGAIKQDALTDEQIDAAYASIRNPK
jgi:hypothetical protein